MGFESYRFELADDMLANLAQVESEWGSPPLAVIHNGACSSTTETDPEVFRTLNVESSQQLFDYCTQKEVPLIYASSASVYGDGSRGFSDKIERNAGERKPSLIRILPIGRPPAEDHR